MESPGGLSKAQIAWAPHPTPRVPESKLDVDLRIYIANISQTMLMLLVYRQHFDS